MIKKKQRSLSIAKLSVGDVAKRSGVKISTLHFYENQDLIQSIRNESNHRRYNMDVLRRIGVIKAAQKVGITLIEIKQALAFLPTNKAPTKRDWQRLSNQWQEKLNKKILQLSALRDKMTGCIGCGCLSLKVCPLYNPDDELGQKETGAVLLNNASRSKAK